MLPLIILDLDGTLIDQSGMVHAKVWQSIEAAQAEGLRFAVCTGRPCMGIAQQIAARLDPEGWHIFQNGALICKTSGQSLRVFALKESSLVALIQYARQHKLVLEIYTPHNIFIERDNDLAQGHARALRVTPLVENLLEVAAREPAVRAQWVVDAAGLELSRALELADIQCGEATSPTMPEAYFISLTQQGVSKGSAVRLLAENMGLALSDIMAVGDSFGDLSMLEQVGHPIVMGNAPQELKTRFRSVPEVEALGVIEAINQAMTLRTHVPIGP